MLLHNYIINQQLAENEEYLVREEIESEFNQYAAECQGNDENPYDSVQLPSTFVPSGRDVRDIIIKEMLNQNINRPKRNIERNGTS